MSGYERGFRSLSSERENVSLQVEGELPGWLDGTLYRNAPAEFEVDGTSLEHWFDGLAMVHRIVFDPDDDRVSYTNRFLRSDAYAAARRGERPGGFATADDRGLLGRLRELLFSEPTDNANVHVARLNDQYVALTETPRAVAFDPETLETLGHPEFSGTTVHHTVAHLRRDDDAGETWGVGVTFGLRNRYRVFRIPDGTAHREPVASIPVSRPAYVHSFALTPRYAVLLEPPFTVDPREFLLGGGAFVDHYEWHPEADMRVLLVDRESGEVTERRTDARFTFHLANAFERTGDGGTDRPNAGDRPDAVVVDAVTYEDASIVADLALDGDAPDQPSAGELRRYRVPLDDAPVTSDALYEGIEMPRFSPTVAGREYSYVYGQATRREGMNGLVKVDAEMGLSQEWWEPDLWAEEPVFVPAPDAAREDEGVVLATALDAAAERTVVLVLEGTTFTERARIVLPHAVPFGFHGEYVPEQ
ncbi:MAG: carotenoid oxygenase family protein [Haloferacaceae archaeon]